MKLALILMLSVFSMSVFAKDLSEVIREIEVNRNAKCTEGRTSFGLCLGTGNGVSATCFYSVKFDCVSNEGDFSLKVKMKSIFGKSKVRKVIYL
jgi:hypothetical protein